VSIIVEEFSNTSLVPSGLMEEFTFLYHDRGHKNVMLVLQSSTESLQLLPHTSSETFPTSSQGTFDFINGMFERHLDMQGKGGKCENK
jgi:hypothetical protein